MKLKKTFFILFISMCLVLCMMSASQAYTLTLETTSDGTALKTNFNQGDELYLNIVLDDASIAGCAFTLNYPSDVLTAPATDENGVPTVLDTITSLFPFSYNGGDTHRENSSDQGKIYFAGAEIDTGNGGTKYTGGETVLFTVKFTVKHAATLGTAQFELVQTELFNPAAGWGNDVDDDGVLDVADGDTKATAPVLVGALDNQDANFNDLTQAFPILLNDAALATADFTIDGDENDIDNDGILDTWEITHFGDLGTADETTDYDHDGYLDIYEEENGTDPKVQDAPYVYANYDPITDNRGPYQVVSTSPESPKAAPGNSFTMDVNYTTTDDNATLAGLGLRIHYDSTKLTWQSFSNVLPTPFSQDVAPQDDSSSDYDNDAETDKYLEILWDSADWPGALPAKLYDVTFAALGTLQEGDTSTIRFTASDTAAGYAFVSMPVIFEAQSFDLDVDGNGEAKALSDGVLIVRYLYGFTGSTLTSGAVDTVNGSRTDATDIQAYLADAVAMQALDVDGNGEAKALSDGVLIVRYLYGFTGSTLTSGAVDTVNGSRTEAVDIQNYLLQYMP